MILISKIKLKASIISVDDVLALNSWKNARRLEAFSHYWSALISGHVIGHGSYCWVVVSCPGAWRSIPIWYIILKYIDIVRGLGVMAAVSIILSGVAVKRRNIQRIKVWIVPILRLIRSDIYLLRFVDGDAAAHLLHQAIRAALLVKAVMLQIIPIARLIRAGMLILFFLLLDWNGYRVFTHWFLGYALLVLILEVLGSHAYFYYVLPKEVRVVDSLSVFTPLCWILSLVHAVPLPVVRLWEVALPMAARLRKLHARLEVGGSLWLVGRHQVHIHLRSSWCAYHGSFQAILREHGRLVDLRSWSHRLRSCLE